MIRQASGYERLVQSYRLKPSAQKIARKSLMEKWTAGDWACATLLVCAALWLIITVLPAFFDGTVAKVVAR